MTVIKHSASENNWVQQISGEIGSGIRKYIGNKQTSKQIFCDHVFRKTQNSRRIVPTTVISVDDVTLVMKYGNLEGDKRIAVPWTN